MPEALFAQKPLVERYLNKARGRLAAVSSVQIFAWEDFFEFDIRVIDGCLCVFARNETGEFLYWPPVGEKISPRAVEECFARMEKTNRGSGVTRIENVSAGQLAWFPREKFRIYNKGYEYCYYREDIAALRGDPYKAKRSSYNQFVRGYQYRYVPFEEEMAVECLELYRHWAEERAQAHADDINVHMLTENRRVHERLMRHSHRLGLTGRVVLVDGKIRAYSFGYPVDETTFCVLFETADLGIKGLPVFIFREFCRDAALDGYKFVNAMDDLGLDHMRAAKMAFRPSVLLPSYVITKAK